MSGFPRQGRGWGHPFGTGIAGTAKQAPISAIRMLAAAYARSGQMQDAQRWLSEADRLWPYDTVRGQFPPC
jgi:hypothetical protein